MYLISGNLYTFSLACWHVSVDSNTVHDCCLSGVSLDYVQIFNYLPFLLNYAAIFSFSAKYCDN